MKDLIISKGLVKCASYALAPNILHFCGPKNSEPGIIRKNLEEYLKKFETLYPYLKLIARANKIRDPFDERVVEAYWLGNNLLDKVSMNDIYRNLVDEHHLKKRLNLKLQKLVFKKIPEGAKPHHSFHVLSVFIRSGHKAVKHTLKTMDECRINFGQIVTARDSAKSGTSGQSHHRGITTPRHSPRLVTTVNCRPLVYKNRKLQLGEPKIKKIHNQIENQIIVPDLKAGDLVTFHWGMVCEKIVPFQAKNLDLWTKYHLRLANFDGKIEINSELI